MEENRFLKYILKNITPPLPSPLSPPPSPTDGGRCYSGVAKCRVGQRLYGALQSLLLLRGGCGRVRVEGAASAAVEADSLQRVGGETVGGERKALLRVDGAAHAVVVLRAGGRGRGPIKAISANYQE